MLSWALPASACPGGGWILGCVPAPCAPGLRCWILAPGHAAPSAWSLFLCPSPSELLPGPRSPLLGAAARAPRAAPGPAVRAAALRELGALSRGAGVCYCPREPEGTPALLGSCSNSLRVPFHREGWCRSCFSGRSFPVLGTLAPASARLLAGPSPLEAFVSLFLFPRLPTLIDARTLLRLDYFRYDLVRID